MSKFSKANKTIGKAVVGSYKAIEDGFVGGYKAIEKGVVGGYKNMENAFVEAFTPSNTPVEEEGEAGANSDTSSPIVNGYQALEHSVVAGYKAVEDTVVGGYKKIESKFVETFLAPDEPAEEQESSNETEATDAKEA